MRYAIQHNATPSGEVSMRLRIAAGALQEASDIGGGHVAEAVENRADPDDGSTDRDNPLCTEPIDGCSCHETERE